MSALQKALYLLRTVKLHALRAFLIKPPITIYFTESIFHIQYGNVISQLLLNDGVHSVCPGKMMSYQQYIKDITQVISHNQ